MRLFYLVKRKRFYYVIFKNPKTGRNLTAKSTGKTKKEEAYLIAMKWLSDGIPEARTCFAKDPLLVFDVDSLVYNIKNINLSENDVDRIINVLKDRGFIADVIKKGLETDLVTYLYDFWNFEKSDYIKEKISHGHRISITRSIDMIGAVKNHWEPFFCKIYLSNISKKHLRDFSLYVADKGLAPKTINNVLSAGFIAIKWAFENGMIKENPSIGIMKFSGKSRKRGILTDEEVQRLFTVGIWTDERCRLANLLACQTGLRAGEITALRVNDIEGNKLHVRHSYNYVEHKLKSTKTGEERTVPILTEIKNQLISLAEKNPYGFNPESYIFFSDLVLGQPIHVNTFRSNLIRALESAGISESERRNRSIDFHSWRHYYSKKMADALNERAMKLTGHKTGSVFENYANHQSDADFKEAEKATEKVFGKMLSFNEAI